MSKKPCDVVLAKSNNQLQPLFSLWSLASQKKVNEGVVERGLRGPRQVMSYLNYKVISIDSESPLEFLNINEESDLMFAKKLLAARKT